MEGPTPPEESTGNRPDLMAPLVAPAALSPRQQTQWRRGQAMELRRNGYSYEEIGARLGVKPKTAWAYVNHYLTTAITDPGEDIRKIELHRLDDLFIRARLHVEDGDPMVSLRAVDRCLHIMERRSKMLGLDVPQKVDLGPWLEEFAKQQGLPVGDAFEVAQRLVAELGF